MGFGLVRVEHPFSIIRVGPSFQLQLAAWTTAGFEHYAYCVSQAESDAIFTRVKEAAIDYGPSFDAVGSNDGPGNESGAKGDAPTLYFNDPNQHLIEIRAYAESTDLD